MTNYYVDGIKNITLKNGVVYIDVFVENSESAILKDIPAAESVPTNYSAGKIITSLPGALQILSNLEGFKNKLLEANVIREGVGPEPDVNSESSIDTKKTKNN